MSRIQWLGQGARAQYYWDAVGHHLIKDFDLQTSPSLHPLVRVVGENSLPIYFIDDTEEAYLARHLVAAYPGVVILTNYFLTKPGSEPLHNSPWHNLVASLRSGVLHETPPLFDWKHELHKARRECALSLVTVFTDIRDRAAFQSDRDQFELLTGADAYIPFPLVDQDINRFRAYPTKVAWCGGVNLEWRPHEILASLRGRDAVWLVDEDERLRAEELCREFNAGSVRIVVGRTPDTWREILDEGVIPLHLLFSGYHSLSPYLEMSIASGLPVITLSYGVTKELPSWVTYHIDEGARGARELPILLARLLQVSEPDELIKARVAYAVSEFSPLRVVDDLKIVIQTAQQFKASLLPHIQILERQARASVLSKSLSDSVYASAFFELGWT